MFPLAHIGITALIASLLSLSPLIAIIASQIPDLIDKPLYILGVFPSGRYIGHTLFAIIILTILIYLFSRKKILAISFCFGMLMHLLQDLPYFIPWFYPFKNYEFPKSSFQLNYTLELFLLDITGLTMLIIVYKNNRQLVAEMLNLKNTSYEIYKKFCQTVYGKNSKNQFNKNKINKKL
ncbi:MAG: metal-dependent hydrolase [Candidatus Aenigmarchaeota archaeon]|nr:metal-dependent hydrolase [Candidatus Aenigmarchaeota archaeon]